VDSLDEEVTSDVKFAQVPHWVLELPLSDKAVRLYAILSKYADNADRTSYPGRGTLAKLMRCHRTSVDRAVQELIDAGCITKQVRYKEGRFTSSLYTVKRIPPSSTDEGSRTHATTPSSTHATTSSHPCDIELEPQNIEPEELVAAAPPEKSAKKDELFEAVAAACGIDWTNLTKTGRGPLNKAVSELRGVGATPDQVSARAQAYRRTYPDAPLTPMALTKHWAALVPARQVQVNTRPKCERCDQPLDDHDQQVCEAFGRFW
jgi:predicted transcriptional regulator